MENGRLIFFTNYESRKGRQLTANPYISLSFVWHKLERQIHIEGKAERCAPADSDAYFASRPYKSKIGARISPQSHVTVSYTHLHRMRSQLDSEERCPLAHLHPAVECIPLLRRMYRHRSVLRLVSRQESCGPRPDRGHTLRITFSPLPEVSQIVLKY